MRVAIALLLLALLAPGAACAGEATMPGQGNRFLLLVRHGMYDRVEGLDDRTANGLNPLGREQARLLAARLAGYGARPDRIVSSDYRRARETADELARKLGMKVALDTLIRECTPSPSDDAASAAACESALAAAWAHHVRPSPDANVREVLVCHGNVIRWFACRALGVDSKAWRKMDIANASITVIAVRADGSTRLISFSDAGHLPAAKQTWAGRGPGWTPATGR